MIDKIVYDNGKIRSGFDNFNCSDDTDMEILCNEVNRLILELKIENKKRNNQINLIKQVLELEEC